MKHETKNVLQPSIYNSKDEKWQPTVNKTEQFRISSNVSKTEQSIFRAEILLDVLKIVY